MNYYRNTQPEHDKFWRIFIETPGYCGVYADCMDHRL